MIPFEIHITGKNSKILPACESLGIKTISVELLDKEFNTIKTEHMTSYVINKESFEYALEDTKEVCEKLDDNFVEVIRTKIECPPFPELYEESIYIESHFTATDVLYPMSRNLNKDYLMATHRITNKSMYDIFKKFHKGRIVEICLYDEGLEEYNYDDDMDYNKYSPDYKWFKHYGMKGF